MSTRRPALRAPPPDHGPVVVMDGVEAAAARRVLPGPATGPRVTTALALALLAALMTVVGCGDPLADVDYRGRALLSLGGPLLMPDGGEFIGNALCYQEEIECAESAAMACGVSLAEPVSDEDCPGLGDCQETLDECVADDDLEELLTASDYVLRLSLFWATTGDVHGPEDEGVEQQSVSTASLPARYTLTLYRPPPARVLHQAARGTYAMAVIVAYYDTDTDGRFDPSAEPLLGGTPEHAILYTPEGVEDPLLGTWPAGYHVLRVDACDPANPVGRYQPADGRLIPVELSGSAPFPRDLMPDPECEDDPGWWEDVCDETMLWLCSQGHQDPLLCDFCGFPFDGDAPNPDLDRGGDPGAEGS